jgi:DNA-binding NarL/FixJ family response regulator
MQSESISIILTEEQIVREGIKSLFIRDGRFAITGETSSGKGVLELLQKGIKADIVVMDVTLPDMDCIKLTELIKKDFPGVKVLILTNQINESYIIKAFGAGVNGYLLKSVPIEELMFAVKHLSEYDSYLSSPIMERFMKRLTNVAEPVALNKDSLVNFSSREIEILTFISLGYTNHEISEKLFTSKRTIENYRQGLIDKTGSRNIVSLVRFAIVNGLIN